MVQIVSSCQFVSRPTRGSSFFRRNYSASHRVVIFARLRDINTLSVSASLPQAACVVDDYYAGAGLSELFAIQYSVAARTSGPEL